MKSEASLQQWLYQASLLWLILLAILAWAQKTLTGGVLHDPLLPLALRYGCLAYEAALSVGYAGLLALCVLPYRAKIITACQYVGLLALIGLYATSWGLFYLNQVFLNIGSILLFQQALPTSFVRLINVNPTLAIGLPVATLISAGFWRWIAGHLGSLNDRGQRLCNVLWLISGFGFFMMYSSATIQARQAVERLHEPQTGLQYRMLERFVQSRDQRSGPVSFVLSDIMQHLTALEPAFLAANTNLDVERPPQMSWSSYLKQVPTDRHPYHVIVVMLASLQPDVLPSFGGRHPVMPHLDALAKRSLRLTQTYAQSSDIGYSTISVLAGRYPLQSLRHQHHRYEAGAPRIFIYDLLHHLGYRTAIFSSRQEHQDGLTDYLQTPGLDVFFHAGQLSGTTQNPISAWLAEQQARWRDRLDDEITITALLKWLKSSHQPSFAYVHLQNSEFPYHIPADFQRRFSFKMNAAPTTFSNLSRANAFALFDRYADSLSYSDRQLKRLFDRLSRQKLWQHTVVIVTGAHGEVFNTLRQRQALHRDMLHVPLVIMAPGLKKATLAALTQHLDIPSMILSILGLPQHPSFQGRSVLSGARNDYTFAVAQTPTLEQYAIQNQHYKLLWDRRMHRSLLFDRVKDPREQHDISNQQPRAFHQLYQTLRWWMQQQLLYYADAKHYQHTYPPHYKSLKSS